MNTQGLLFENSKDIPEGLYLKLMNSLKIDFKEAPKKKFPKKVDMNKSELLLMLGSKNWANKEEVVSKLALKNYKELKDWCKHNKISIKKDNPKYVEDDE
jgi:hypothetical protein